MPSTRLDTSWAIESTTGRCASWTTSTTCVVEFLEFASGAIHGEGTCALLLDDAVEAFTQWSDIFILVEADTNLRVKHGFDVKCLRVRFERLDLG